jgi:hypothetical protein
VEVGEAVAEAGAEVQQHRGGLVGHAGVAVGGTGGHALEQPEDAPHLGHVVERGDEVHLGGAGVHEAHVDAASTSVRMRAWAPFMASLLVGGDCPGRPIISRRCAGVQDPVGVEGRLDAAHEVELGRVLEREGTSSSRCRCRARRTSRRRARPRREQVVHHAGRGSRVLLEHGEVHVAVAGVAAADDPSREPRRSPHPAHVLGDGGARDHDVDDVVAPASLATQKAFSRAAMSVNRRSRREHVDVERPEPR